MFKKFFQQEIGKVLKCEYRFIEDTINENKCLKETVVKSKKKKILDDDKHELIAFTG